MKHRYFLSILLLIIPFSLWAKINVTFTGSIGGDSFTYYTEAYADALEQFFAANADAFTISNVSQPVFGEPYRDLVLGVTGGLATATPPDAGQAGSQSLGYGFGVTAAPFLTLSLDPLSSLLDLEFFKDSDFTIKLLPLSLHIKETHMKFFNLGLFFRKQYHSKAKLWGNWLTFLGTNYGVGLFYTRNTISTVVDIDHAEYVALPDGSVAVLTAEKAYLNFETESSSLDFEFKGYVNVLWVMDFFAGAGLTVNTTNKFTTNSRIPGHLEFLYSGTSGSGDGTLLMTGSGEGQAAIFRIMGGFQVNLGPVKIPVQYTKAVTKNVVVHVTTFGVSLSF